MKNNQTLLNALLEAQTTDAVEGLLNTLPIVESGDYEWNSPTDQTGSWQAGKLHWVPVGYDRGNGGRIRLANEPINPIAERIVNGMEAIIERERLLELGKDPNSSPPATPRDSAFRYFGLPPLDAIERMDDQKERELKKRINAVRRQLVVRVDYAERSDQEAKKKEGPTQFTVSIRDHGIGQRAEHIHDTLLSLGKSDKPDKPYLIGLFGQGGSSAFAACEYSIVISLRDKKIDEKYTERKIGWTIVRQHIPTLRRDPYYQYLAAEESGAVPSISIDEGVLKSFPAGTYFAHINYDFGFISSVVRELYQALNHTLFNPILPYDLYVAKDKPDPMKGTAQRLARKIRMEKSTSKLDRVFSDQQVAMET